VASIFNDTEFLQSRGFTVLHKIVLGLITMPLEVMLEHSTADLDIVDCSGRTCVSWAAARGDEQALKTLLDFGADPNVLDVQGSAPIHHVRDSACCQLLLQNGADITCRNTYGHTALHSVTRNRKSLALADTLLRAGIDIDAKDFSHETALCNTTVALEDQAERVQFFLANGADPDARTDSGDSLVHHATAYNAHNVLTVLFEHGVDYTVTNIYGRTILHQAARVSDEQSLSLFKRYAIDKIDPAALDHDGKSAQDHLNEREEERMEPGFRKAFEDLVQSIKSSQEMLSSLVHEMAAVDLVKEASVSCFAPLSVETYDDEYVDLCNDAVVGYGQVVFYDALEQVPVDIAV